MKKLNLVMSTVIAAMVAGSAVTTASAEESGAGSAEKAAPTTQQASPRQSRPQGRPPMPYGGMPPYGMMPPQGMSPYGPGPMPYGMPPQGMAPRGMVPYGGPGMNPYGPPMGYRAPNYGPNQYNAPGFNPSFNPPTMEPPWGNDKSLDMSPMRFWPVPGTGNPWHHKPWEPGAPWGDSDKFADPPDEAFHEAEDFLADAPRMPGGWELPNISMPSPFEIGEQVGDQSWLLPENFKMRDRKRPSRYRKYFPNEK